MSVCVCECECAPTPRIYSIYEHVQSVTQVLLRQVEGRSRLGDIHEETNIVCADLEETHYEESREDRESRRRR